MTFTNIQAASVVLMATRNGAAHVVEQVRSVLLQDVSSLQVVLGDDNSTDDTVGVLTAAVVDARLHVIRYPHSSGGAGQSFLRLIRDTDLSAADFVAFSDQDDIWNRDKLERAIAVLDAQGADGYSSAVTAFWPDGRETVLGQNPNPTDLDFLFEGAGQGCTFVLRGDFARKVQRFVCNHRNLLDGVHYHDWLIYAVSRALKKRWVFDPMPSMRYRQHDGNDTGARSALAGVRKRLALIRGGWYGNQVRQMIAIVSTLDATGTAISGDFRALWNHRRNWVRRLSLAALLFRRGRRRFSDRSVLAVSALLGWL